MYAYPITASISPGVCSSAATAFAGASSSGYYPAAASLSPATPYHLLPSTQPSPYVMQSQCPLGVPPTAAGYYAYAPLTSAAAPQPTPVMLVQQPQVPQLLAVPQLDGLPGAYAPTPTYGYPTQPPPASWSQITTYAATAMPPPPTAMLPVSAVPPHVAAPFLQASVEASSPSSGRHGTSVSGGETPQPLRPKKPRGPQIDADGQPIERSSTQLIVNYLDNQVTGRELLKIFSSAGVVESVRIMHDPVSNQPLGYGFVYFRSAQDAQRAVDSLNKFPLRRKRLKVSFANLLRHEREHQRVAGNQFLDMQQAPSNDDEVDGGDDASEPRQQQPASEVRGDHLPSQATEESRPQESPLITAFDHDAVPGPDAHVGQATWTKSTSNSSG